MKKREDYKTEEFTYEEQKKVCEGVINQQCYYLFGYKEVKREKRMHKSLWKKQEFTYDKFGKVCGELSANSGNIALVKKKLGLKKYINHFEGAKQWELT